MKELVYEFVVILAIGVSGITFWWWVFSMIQDWLNRRHARKS